MTPCVKLFIIVIYVNILTSVALYSPTASIKGDTRKISKVVGLTVRAGTTNRNNFYPQKMTTKKYNTVKSATQFGIFNPPTRVTKNENSTLRSNNIRVLNLSTMTASKSTYNGSVSSRASMTSGLNNNRTQNNEKLFDSNKMTTEFQNTPNHGNLISSVMSSTNENKINLSSTKIVTSASKTTLQKTRAVSTKQTWIVDSSLTELQGNKYFFSDPRYENKIWHEARDFCQQYGMHLVTIETKRENDAITAKIAKLLDGTVSDFYWIGLNDLKKEGEYRWASDNKIAKFTDWRVGEPNNGLNAEDCVQIWRKKVLFMWFKNWSDGNCQKMGPFICELPSKADLESHQADLNPIEGTEPQPKPFPAEKLFDLEWIISLFN